MRIRLGLMPLEILQAPVERCSGHQQKARSFGAVIVGLCEGKLDFGALLIAVSVGQLREVREVVAKMLACYPRGAVRLSHERRHRLIELAQIPGPRRRHKCAHDSGVECGRPIEVSALCCTRTRKMRHQLREVGAALAQGWDENAMTLEPKVQVTKELPPPHQSLEWVGRGRDESSIQRLHAILAKRTNLMPLDDSKKLRLHASRCLAYLIEEDSSAIGRREEPRPAITRAGKRALGVTKQLRRCEPFIEGGEVDDLEGPVRAG